MILSGGIPTNSKSKTSCAYSNLTPRFSTSKGLPRLRPRYEARKSEICRVGRNRDRRAMVEHFGACVNDVRNFSIKMGEKNGLRKNGECRALPLTETLNPFTAEFKFKI
ncbi:hypothetical protein AVEN_39872-1 [Araneus ventricosus]|uniref:Uncharacterized protein n=1 Tax=Araneus ventricosus TaxID=182803 RepID=A0A4Y2KT68_ARAVE|nr:hypothetical protein AVEN_39872-1 [Araneus ventricosus]